MTGVIKIVICVNCLPGKRRRGGGGRQESGPDGCRGQARPRRSAPPVVMWSCLVKSRTTIPVICRHPPATCGTAG